MHVVACHAPIGSLEPAPLTSLTFHMGVERERMSAFWGSDDEYLVRVDGPAGAAWFRIEAEPAVAPASADEARAAEATRVAIGALMADILPLGAGRVAFPVGSSGRRVFRVWRASEGASRGGKTRILGVRAGRSRRQPA